MASDHTTASLWKIEATEERLTQLSADILSAPSIYMIASQATGNDGEAALKETGSINRSLFTLGQVLAGLSMRKPSFRYPFICLCNSSSTPSPRYLLVWLFNYSCIY